MIKKTTGTIARAMGVLTLAAAAAVVALPAQAAGPACAPRTAIVAQLSARHGESQVALGLADGGQVMELWVAPDGGWTLLASLPSGASCVIAAGEQLQLLSPKAAEPPRDPV